VIVLVRERGSADWQRGRHGRRRVSLAALTQRRASRGAAQLRRRVIARGRRPDGLVSCRQSAVHSDCVAEPHDLSEQRVLLLKVERLAVG